MNMQPQFTILLPVHRPPSLLPFAIESVLAQEQAAFELFIVCDGAPPATAECARAYAARDPRIRVFVFDKGERHGEAHRHVALESARAPWVAQIADDDLWFPDYLGTLGRLLERVDFGNLLQGDIAANGQLLIHVGDLADETVRQRMLSEPIWNFFGPSFAGYRLSAYRRLPVGWSPAPAGLVTDLHMWRKFLRRSDLTFGTHFAVHGVKLEAATRTGMSLDARLAESTAVVRQLADPHERQALVARGFRALWHRLHRAQVDAAQALVAAEQQGQAQLQTAAAAAEAAQAAQAAHVAARQQWDAQAAMATRQWQDAQARAASTLQAWERLKAENEQLKTAHAHLLGSKSWRITRPLRWVRRWW